MRRSERSSRVSPSRRSLLGLCALLPLLMGGCPEFRNDVVGVFESAARSTLLGAEDEWTIVHASRGALVDATIDLVFDVLRANDLN